MHVHVDRLRKHSLHFKIVLPTPHLALCSYKLSFTRVWPVSILIEKVTEIFFTFSFIYNFQWDIQELPQNNETDCSFNCRHWSNELVTLLYYQRSVNSTQSTYFDKAPREYEVQCFNYYCNVVMHLLIKQFCFLLIDFKHILLFFFYYCILYIKKLDQSNII